MRSRGGIVSAALAAQQPVTLFLSGPAGGVIGARFAAERSGVRDFVSLDMGGTSNDVAVVRDGEPLIASRGLDRPVSGAHADGGREHDRRRRRQHRVDRRRRRAARGPA